MEHYLKLEKLSDWILRLENNFFIRILHITYNLYNSMPNFMKWIFDFAKRDVHVRLTSILGGVIGVTQK